MYTELQNVLKTRACPKCTVVGRMTIMESQAYIQCGACHATHLDPFEVGPWETRIVESVDEKIVSAYTITKKEPEPLEENEKIRDFYKFMNKDAASRMVEGEFPVIKEEPAPVKRKKKVKELAAEGE